MPTSVNLSVIKLVMSSSSSKKPLEAKEVLGSNLWKFLFPSLLKVVLMLKENLHSKPRVRDLLLMILNLNLEEFGFLLLNLKSLVLPVWLKEYSLKLVLLLTRLKSMAKKLGKMLKNSTRYLNLNALTSTSLLSSVKPLLLLFQKSPSPSLMKLFPLKLLSDGPSLRSLLMTSANR